MRKKIYIFLGPSGSGKTTLSQIFKNRGIPELVSTTTRKIRLGEIHGVHYYFVEDDEFDTIEMLERSTYAGKKYGLSKAELDNKLQNYDTVFAILDKFGMQIVKDLYSNVADVYVIYCYCSPKTVYDRMLQRGTAILDAESRMENLKLTGELNNIELADFVIITDKHPLEKCKKQLEFILDGM